MRAILALVLATLLAVPWPLAAQEDPRAVLQALAAGERVSIVLTTGDRFTAAFLELQGDSLLVRGVDTEGRRIAIPSGPGRTGAGEVRINVPSIASVSRLAVRPVTARNRGTFDPATLAVGDRVKVTTDRVHAGTVADVNIDGLMLKTGDGLRQFPVAEIRKITRRTNGVALGFGIGTGGGFVAALPLIAIGQNEGGQVAGPVVLLVVAGAAIGTLVDGLIGRYRTVYELQAR